MNQKFKGDFANMWTWNRTRMFSLRAMCAFTLVVSASGAAPAHADGDQPALQLNRIQQRLLSGLADVHLQTSGDSGRSAVQTGQESGPDASISDSGNDQRRWPFYFPTEDDVCPQNRGANVRVSQDCQNLSDPDLPGRSQAQNETSIGYDSNNPRHLISTFNDYRRGDGGCGGSFSLDGGQNWAEIIIPFSFTRARPTFNPNPNAGPTRQYWQGGGDTSIAFDTQGNAYFSCQVFNRGGGTSTNRDLSSAMLVFRSTGNAGGSWNFPGRYVTAANDLKATGAPFEDKQLLTVDNHVGSPFQDRVYVSWTEFAADGTAYIWLAYSADYGETFSPRHLVSVTSKALCTNTYGLATPQGTCNENQFSQPFTSPDGTLYVLFSNFNNPTSNLHGNDGPGEEPPPAPGAPGGPGVGAAPVTPIENKNQVLLTKSTDGGETFSAPVKVADYYDLPDCATYQAGKDFGRACVPEKGSTTNSYFRATNYGSGKVNPTDPRQVVVTFGSYINRYSNETRPTPCIPVGFNPATGNNLFIGVKTPAACNNKILVSVSNNAGATFTGTTTNPRLLPTVNQAPRQIGTDQWFQWADFTPEGRLAVSYYDRQYGDDEVTGFSDFSLSGTASLRDPMHPVFGTRRATTSSMPPPTQFSGTFWGDYTGLTAPGLAYPTWSDTRNPELVLCPGTGKIGVPPRVCTSSDPQVAPNAARANDQDVFAQGLAIPVGGEHEDGNN